MDAVDTQNVSDFIGGGPVSIAVGIILMVIFGYVKASQKKAQRDSAEKETDLQRQVEQAKTQDRNQDLQDNWDDASEGIHQARKNRGKQ